MEGIPVLDLLSCFAVAGELGRGQPAGHISRTATIAVAVADRMGLDEQARLETCYTSLLLYAGCPAGMEEIAALLLCDELALQRDVCLCDPSHQLEVVRVLLRHAGSRGGTAARVRGLLRFASGGSQAFREIEVGCSEVGDRIAARLGMPARTVEALADICETWNGKGPHGKGGEAIPVIARIVNAAMTAELFLTDAGPEGARDAVRRRAGRSIDPAVAAVLSDLLSDPAFVQQVERARDWAALAELDPPPLAVVGGDAVDTLTLACADFADLRVAGSTAHSRRVGELAEAVMLRLGNRAESALARRAGHVHAIGQVALPAGLLANPRPSVAETEQIRLLPAFTRRILAGSPALATIGQVAGMHRERVDGSGYPDGRGGAEIPVAARAVAAACAYDESRMRDADAGQDAALAAFREMGERAFGADVTKALCDEVAGAKRPARRDGPGGLTEREVEVLRLAAVGQTTGDIAKTLVISKHTARHHLESIYAKAGVKSRAGAALFAMEQGLLL